MENLYNTISTVIDNGIRKELSEEIDKRIEQEEDWELKDFLITDSIIIDSGWEDLSEQEKVNIRKQYLNY